MGGRHYDAIEAEDGERWHLVQQSEAFSCGESLMTSGLSTDGSQTNSLIYEGIARAASSACFASWAA